MFWKFAVKHVDTASFPGGSADLPANAGVSGNEGSISGSGRSLGEGNGNPLQHSFLQEELLKEIPWTEEPGGLQSVGSKQSETTEHTWMEPIRNIKWMQSTGSQARSPDLHPPQPLQHPGIHHLCICSGGRGLASHRPLPAWQGPHRCLRGGRAWSPLFLGSC